MTTRRGAGLLAVLLALGACDTPAHTPPTSRAATVSAAPSSPAADARRLEVCAEATRHAAAGVELLKEYGSADPADVDRDRVATVLRDMSATQKEMPPALASLYDSFTSPVALLALAPATGVMPDVTAEGLQTSGLLFMASCESWAQGG